MLAFDETTTELEQGSDEWLAWRRRGIGSSDVPTLMGESDYDETPLTIWKRKTGRLPEKESNYAMNRGTEQEPRARALYEMTRDYDTPPTLVIGREYPWARASLDGYNEQKGIVVEFKFLGKEKHALAVNGEIPKCHYGQVQYQLYVSGAKCADYVSLNPEGAQDVAVVRVFPDYEYWKRMLPVLQEFWKCIETDTPPPLTADDFMELESGSNLEAFEKWSRAKMMVLQLEDVTEELSAKLKGAKERLKEESEKLESVRAEIQGLTCTLHPKLRCNGIKAWTVQRKNGPTVQIDWDKKSTHGTTNT